jgi:hypothetical protein
MSTSSEQQAEKNAQNKTISGLTQQLNTLTAAIKLMGKDMVGKGGGAVGSGASKAANVVIDATLEEIPGGKAIAGMVGDAKKYFTGLKERAKSEAEKKSSKNKSKDIIDTIEKSSQNESREFIHAVEKSRHENSADNKEIIKEVKKVTEVVKESNNIAIIEGLEESHELKHLTHELEKSRHNESHELISELEKSRHNESTKEFISELEKSRHNESTKEFISELEKSRHNESHELISELEKSRHNESHELISELEKSRHNESHELISELEKSKDTNSANNKETTKAIKETTKAIKESNDIAKREAAEEKIKAIKDKDTVAASQLVKPNKDSHDEKSSGIFGALGAVIISKIGGIIKSVTGFLRNGLAITGKNIMKGLGTALRFAGSALFLAIRLLNPIGWALLIADLLVTFKDEIIGFFKGDGFKNFIQSTKQLLINAWDGIVKFFKETDWSGLIKSAGEAIGDLICKLGKWFKDSMVSLWEGVKSWVADLSEVISVIGSAIYDNLLKPIGDWIKDKVKGMWDAVTETIGEWVTEFKKTVSDKWDGAKQFLSDLPHKLMEPFDTLIDWFKTFSIGGKLNDLLSGVTDKILEGFASIYNMTIAKLPGVDTKMLPNGKLVKSDDYAEYEKLVDAGDSTQIAADKVKGMWDAVTDKISGWITDFKTLVSDKWDGAKQFLNDIPNKLMEPFDTLIKWFDNARLGGKLNDLLSGVGDKIVEGFASIYNMTIGKLPGVDKMLQNGKLVSSDDYGEYEKLVGAGDSTQIAAAKIAQMISDREAANPSVEQPGLISRAVGGVGNLVGSVGRFVADGARYVYNAIKPSSDGKYQIISNGGRTSAVGAKGKFDASSSAMQDLLSTNTGLNNSLPTGVAGDSIKNNLVRVDEQIWEPLKRIDPGVKISSGFRSKEVNQRIGGALQSDHTEGRAIDIVPGPGQTPTDLANAIIDNNLPFSKLIVEPSWVHVSLPKEGETNVQRLVMVSDDAMAENSKYGPVKIEAIHLNNDLPPISGNHTRAQVTGKITSSTPISSPTPITGNMVATGTASVSNANAELNAAIVKSASDSTSGATVAANNGNTVNNVTVINTSAKQYNNR